MQVQQAIQAHRLALLMFSGMPALALAAHASPAAASPATTGTFATAEPAMLPIDGRGGYTRLHPVRKVFRGTIEPRGIARANTSGVTSTRGPLVHVDETGHVVNAKGARIGGRTQD